MIRKNKKILIVGQSFNTNTGGGITITNLFAGRREGSFAVATFGGSVANTELNSNVELYQLGIDEINVKFPFNLFKKKYLSGVIKIGSGLKVESEKLKKKNSKIRMLIMQKMLSLTKTIGVYEYIESYSISDKFRYWINTYSPDVIYTQLGAMPLLSFVENISSEYKIPIIVHIMDDWPSTIAGYWGALFKDAINKRITRFFNKCSLHLAISTTMAVEYTKRYGGKWFVFHNSIDISKWRGFIVSNDRQKKFKILYLGRIGVANSRAIIDFAKSVSEFNTDVKVLEFHLYSLTEDKKIVDYLSSFKNVFCNSPVPHSEVPDLMIQFDLLLLPLDFSARAIKFTKYSMPTKMSEYMMSGVPIFILAPNTCAVSTYAEENHIAFVCTSNKKEYIKKALRGIISENESRIKFAENALKLAIASHDTVKEHKRFEELIRDLQ